MKVGFIVSAISIPLFNLIVICVGSVFNINNLILMAISVVGTILIGVLVFNLLLKPYMYKMALLEKQLAEAKRLERSRTDFIYSISNALRAPASRIESGMKEISELGIDINDFDKSAESKSEKEESLQNSWYSFTPQKEERDKKKKISKANYKNEVIKERIIEMSLESRKLARLTEDMLELSEVESKKYIATNGKVSVEQGIHEAINELIYLVDEKDLEVIVDIEDNLYIEGAAERFKTMMRHIIDNAFRYSGTRGQIWINAMKIDGIVIINVRDEGVGISPEDQKRIFDRFFRVKTLNDLNPTGTGLGLSIASIQARLLDAEIKVKSTYGEGSTFSIIFKRGL